MTIFIDTSAFYAVFDRDDSNHQPARAAWEAMLGDGSELLTNNYVLLETCALLQHRLGLAALRTFHEDVVPLVRIDWVAEGRHRAAAGAVVAAGRRKLSLVDCVSFQTMRELGVRSAFCFDKHFKDQGFETIP